MRTARHRTIEDNLIWRVADLLGVSSRERIALRQRVAAARERRPRMTPVTVITGASAGIGVELARVFAGHGHALVLVARREQLLAALAAEIAAAGGPRPLVLPLDLAQPDAAARIAEALAARGLEPEYVVNNAGFGLVGRAADLDRAEQLAMIDLNVRALTDLSLAFVDSLARQRGGMLNVASVAGFLPGPGAAVYYASKAYVLSFSEALHRELEAPGRARDLPVPRSGRDRIPGARRRAERRRSWPLAVSAERVADEGYRGLMARRRLVCRACPTGSLPAAALRAAADPACLARPPAEPAA